MDGDYDGEPTGIESIQTRLREGDAPHWASSDWHEKNGFTRVDRGVVHCICGHRVADEIELRVHQHYDHWPLGLSVRLAVA